MQTKDEVKAILDLVIGQSASIFKLFTSEDQTLTVGGMPDELAPATGVRGSLLRRAAIRMIIATIDSSHTSPVPSALTMPFKTLLAALLRHRPTACPTPRRRAPRRRIPNTIITRTYPSSTPSRLYSPPRRRRPTTSSPSKSGAQISDADTKRCVIRCLRFAKPSGARRRSINCSRRRIRALVTARVR